MSAASVLIEHQLAAVRRIVSDWNTESDHMAADEMGVSAVAALEAIGAVLR